MKWKIWVIDRDKLNKLLWVTIEWHLLSQIKKIVSIKMAKKKGEMKWNWIKVYIFFFFILLHSIEMISKMLLFYLNIQLVRFPFSHCFSYFTISYLILLRHITEFVLFENVQVSGNHKWKKKKNKRNVCINNSVVLHHSLHLWLFHCKKHSQRNIYRERVRVR